MALVETLHEAIQASAVSAAARVVQPEAVAAPVIGFSKLVSPTWI